MAAKSRREREREDRKELILDAARQVVTAEGLDGLSIRKIAARIEYSPAIIYHYFANKEEIVNQMLNEGYDSVLRSVGSAQQGESDPEKRIARALRGYIATAMENPDYFKAFILSESPQILSRTAALYKGAARERPSLAMMCRDLKYLLPERDEDWLELTAQILWVTLFGLTARLLIEKDVSEKQRNRLIARHAEFVLGAIKGFAPHETPPII